MSEIQALILGLIQGLTEFLPISSSGHIEIGKAMLGVSVQEDFTFTIVVHGATVLSTIVVFYKEIVTLIKDLFRFEMNASTIYALKLVLSMIPVVIIGLFFKDEFEALVAGNVVLVGAMLLITAAVLGLTHWVKTNDKEISFGMAAVIGLAQAVAVMPGISRSGATIATALLMGSKRAAASRFSFLMVLIPILGANAKSVLDGEISQQMDAMPLVIGFVAAFLSGLVACRLMIRIVNKGRLVWFAGYCVIAGIAAMIFG